MNKAEHDEASCDELHEEISFTLRAYGISKGSIAFETWFNEVFKNSHPQIADGFSFSRNDTDDHEVIEIMQWDPFFQIDSLEILFYQSRFVVDKAVKKQYTGPLS